MPDRDDDYVGYGHPPKWGQIRKGEVRNPKGRPRKKAPASPADPGPERESDAILRQLLDREFEITEGGRARSVKTSEILSRKLVKLAVDGNVHALRLVHRQVELLETREVARAAAQEEAERQKRQEQAERVERRIGYLRDLKQTQQRRWSEALAGGRDEPDEPWPHPEDIIPAPDGAGYWIRGPLDAQGVAAWERLRRLRNYFLREIVLAIRSGAAEGLERLWLAMMVQEDRTLPLRWQIAHDIGPATDALIAMRLPQLQQIVEQDRAWIKRTSGPTPLSKEHYRELNTLFRPALKVLGYGSLKQFKRACEDTGGDPPVPGPTGM